MTSDVTSTFRSFYCNTIDLRHQHYPLQERIGIHLGDQTYRSKMKAFTKIATLLLALVMASEQRPDVAPHHARDNLLPRETPPPSSTTTTAPCPTTLTVENVHDCSGCTTTSYDTTSTFSTDCGGCTNLTTVTHFNRLFGLCPVSRG